MRMKFNKAISLIALGFALPVYAAPQNGAPTIEDFGNLPAFEEAAISPSGNRVAMIASLNDMRSLVVFEAGKIIKNSQLGDVKVRDLEWASDDLLTLDYSKTEKLYGFSAEKAEFYRTIVLSISQDKLDVIFAKQKNVASATFGWYGIREIGGKIFGYFGGVPMVEHGNNNYIFEGGPPALYQVDLANMVIKQVAKRGDDGERRSWRLDANGDVAATLIRKDGSGDWRILNSDNNEIAKGSNPYGGIWMVSLNEGGNSIVYGQENEESGQTSYFEAPLAGGTPTEIFADLDIKRFYVHPRSGRLIGYMQKGTPPKLSFFDPVTDKNVAKIAKAFPKVNRSMVDWTLDFGKVILATNGNGDSGTWWTVDLQSKAASPLGYERPPIDPVEVGAISKVPYKAKDGLEMDGILTLPPGKEAKNLPIIMLPHGGPTAHDTESFDWWAQAFASRGYAVFQPNFRGSTNRDAAFTKAGHGEWGRKMQTDISDGLSHLAAQGVVDPKRACIVGASYGGYAALAGVTLQQGLYRCSVSVAGVSDLNMMISTDIAESGSNATLKRILKTEIGSGRELKEVSPRRFAAKADAPIMLIHGKDDTVVPFRQSTVMADALKDAGKQHEFVTLAGEDHWLSRGETRLKMLQTTVTFVEKHNPPD
jgi:dienelactone hydrolase